MNKQENDPQNITQFTEQELSLGLCRGIYGLRNKLNDKWYVGKTINKVKKRWQAYARFDCEYQPKLLHALKKYGYEGFEKVVLEVCPADYKILKEREDFWINHHDSIKNGYNCITSINGGVVSEGTRQKLSLAHKDKKFTLIHRLNLSKSLKGRKISLGQKRDAESRARMSIAATKREEKKRQARLL